MVTKPTKPVLVAIVGETASGKSTLAIDLAEKYNGEIICADSRTVYMGMDVGTAKPSLEDRRRVSHHLLDVVSPDQRFAAAEFKQLAIQAVDDITSRGKIPFLVGGTGLYVDGVLFDFDFSGEADEQLRAELQKLSDHELQERARQLGITEDQVNFLNPRHLARAVERGGVAVQEKLLRPDSLIIGIQTEKEKLEKRIRQRVDEQLKAGLEEEVKQLAERYGWQTEAMSAIGYKEWQAYFDGEQTLDETRELLCRHSIQYAKRQRTWFKRNRSIYWVSSTEQADRAISDFLLQ